MTYDDKIAKLFLLNFKESYRSAKLLNSSYERLKNILPLSDSRLDQLSTEELERLDAFRVRFCDLQDALGSKVFRTLVKLEEENVGSQLDIINQMEKRKIITSFNAWRKIREVRKLFSHDYPEEEIHRIEALNIAYENVPILLNVLNEVRKYVISKIGISMSEFTTE